MPEVRSNVRCLALTSMGVKRVGMDGHPYRKPDDELAGVVQSIRVASALNERVGKLAQPRHYERADEMANAIGELEQLYPEVWSHLDVARAALAERGITVAAYDELRASTRTTGLLEVDTLQQGLMGRTATVDPTGHAAAVEACNLLKGALPQIDWVALDRVDDQLAHVRLGPPRWVSFAVIAAAVAFILYLLQA